MGPRPLPHAQLLQCCPFRRPPRRPGCLDPTDKARFPPALLRLVSGALHPRAGFQGALPHPHPPAAFQGALPPTRLLCIAPRRRSRRVRGQGCANAQVLRRGFIPRGKEQGPFSKAENLSEWKAKPDGLTDASNSYPPTFYRFLIFIPFFPTSSLLTPNGALQSPERSCWKQMLT